jgi:hypothetical protein
VISVDPDIQALVFWIVGYIEFGLAIFASIGVVGQVCLFVKHRKRLGCAFQDLVQIGVATLFWLMLDGVRAIWDTHHKEKFPVYYSLGALAVLFTVIAIATFRLRSGFESQGQ